MKSFFKREKMSFIDSRGRRESYYNFYVIFFPDGGGVERE